MPGSSRRRSTSASGDAPGRAAARARSSRGERLDRAGTAADDAELGDVARSARQRDRRARERAVDVGPGCRDVGAEARDEPARERSRGGDRHLLAEHGAHRELEARRCCRQAKPRLARQADERLGDRLGRRIEVEPAPHAAITAPLALPSAGANARWTRAASVAKRASIQPAGAASTPARMLRRIDLAVVDSTPGIARWAMNAINGATSNGAR
jgi:hypothetical protein